MTVKSVRDALNEALFQEMRRDPSVIVMGEDVSGGAGGSSGSRDAAGGIFGVTKGLITEFGEHRVIDTPISESAIIGLANGAALTGMRPVAELMFADFVGVAMDQIYNQLAKFRYMFGGKAKAPVVVRMSMGAGMNAGAQHSQTIYSMLSAVPGLKVVVPSNPADAKGMLAAAIRDDDPVIFLEHKALYSTKGEVPDGEYIAPLHGANLVQSGKDATVVTLGRMVPFSQKASAKLAEEGITFDLIDLRSTSPIDEELILESLSLTGRLVVVDESNPMCSIASEIAAIAAEKGFSSLRGPVIRVTAPHTPVPFARELERMYVPGPDRIAAAIRKAVKGE
ncbi:alpha-ketoacid dehydrogenase subunit beta [Paracoccus sp. DMF-8]|uniref:alpha-ketoacid dehydrogenase subunit beta n=1 Tax=Paracoccus sp. DMF-8 TaxID=3019445 RepID=UPI0023E41A6C|nr:alpha-ketoacid dehydrogenase subunit beta [Paracoccus sp. DMF-8]MDF3608089.1 alpha-ketoacid dehydrogenase subunit beta [Paracoccus sp. DMF-8]